MIAGPPKVINKNAFECICPEAFFLWVKGFQNGIAKEKERSDEEL
jgi:hypothetical protein